MDSALIHRARLQVVERGARNAQGEYVVPDDPDWGPWFPARVMLRGAVAPETARQDGSTASRTARQFELLAADTDEVGGRVVLLASSVVATDCDLLGSPVLALDGEPELLNDGQSTIGWLAYATRASDGA